MSTRVYVNTMNQFDYTLEGIRRSIANGEEPFTTSTDQQVWESAENLSDLGSATADWLEGKISFRPTRRTYRSVNEESVLLLPYINPLNRSGNFVSTFSQPASTPDSNPLKAMFPNQRAALSGFATYEMTKSLAAGAGKIGVRALVSRPGSKAKRCSVVVTTNTDGCTSTGNVDSPENIARKFSGVIGRRIGLQPSVIEALKGCYQISLYDEEYGNNDRLWPMIVDVAKQYQKPTN